MIFADQRWSRDHVAATITSVTTPGGSGLSGRLAIRTLIVLSTILVTTGCSTSPSLPKGAVGNAGRYNYSPSVIETGNTRQFWWCSPGVNPNDTSQARMRSIIESINMSTLATDGPVLVMAETPGAWDSAFTCNPKVIGGIFQNPLGDGQNYSYAMYYVATEWLSGDSNNIGVAFSNDGIVWKKYPQPVIAINLRIWIRRWPAGSLQYRS